MVSFQGEGSDLDLGLGMMQGRSSHPVLWSSLKLLKECRWILAAELPRDSVISKETEEKLLPPVCPCLPHIVPGGKPPASYAHCVLHVWLVQFFVRSSRPKQQQKLKTEAIKNGTNSFCAPNDILKFLFPRTSEARERGS